MRYRLVALSLGLLSDSVASAQQMTLVRCRLRSSAPCASVVTELPHAAIDASTGLDSAVSTVAWRARFLGDTGLAGVARPLSSAG